MDQCGGRQGIATTAAAQASAGHPPEFVVDGRQQSALSGSVTATPRQKQTGQIAPNRHPLYC
jgi:hypothetical protein